MGDSEIGLDIKDLMTQPDNGVMLDLQMRKMFDSSRSGDAQGDMPVFCIFENRDADQLHGNSAYD